MSYLDEQEDEHQDQFDTEGLDEDADDDDITDDADDGDDQDARGGNLAKALQEERRWRKENEVELKGLKEQLATQNALLQRLGQTQAQPQPNQPVQMTPEQLEQYQQVVLERPEQFFNMIGQQVRGQIMQELSPQLQGSLVSSIASNPEYGDLYKVPAIKKGVDAYLKNASESGYMPTVEDVTGAMGFFADIYKAGQGPGGNTKADPGKGRLTSVVGKGKGSSQAAQASAQRKYDSWQKMRETNPSKYLQKIRSPEGKEVWNALFAQN